LLGGSSATEAAGAARSPKLTGTDKAVEEDADSTSGFPEGSVRALGPAGTDAELAVPLLCGGSAGGATPRA